MGSLIKHGVWEHEEMKYPWFAPKMQVFESGEVQDMCGEDVSFCLDAIAAGLRFGATHVLELGTKKQGLSDMGERYNIINSVTGEVLHSNLSQEEYFDIMEDYALQYYDLGSPRPEVLSTQMVQGD